MTRLTRRTLLAGAGAAAALGPLARQTQAAAPPAGKQAPGFYRYKVGDYELTQITDGARSLPIADGYVKNVSKEQAIAAAEAAYMPKGMVTVPFNPLVINTGSRMVLIDTGFPPGAGPTIGLLQSNMAAAGIDPKAIDVVILSHLHPDHINGIKTPSGALAFPNAEIKAPSVDWAFWMSDENMSKFQDNQLMRDYFDNTRKVLSDIAGKVTRYDWGKEVAPGITSVEAAGHTPGHTAFVVASGNGRLLVQSDVTNIPELFLRNPDWHVMYDFDPVKAAATRHRFYDMAAAEKALIAGFHFAFPSLGHVEKDGANYRLVPIAWNAML
jgi:glyoxylase-like metal-dependent hydrolase (beta-lactamase superfamily II)